MAKKVEVKASFVLIVSDDADDKRIQDLISYWIANYMDIDDVDDWNVISE